VNFIVLVHRHENLRYGYILLRIEIKDEVLVREHLIVDQDALPVKMRQRSPFLSTRPCTIRSGR